MSFKHHSIANFIIYRLIPKLNKSRDNLTTQCQKSQLHSHYWTGTFKLPDTFFYPYIFNFFFKSDSQKSIFASGVIQTPFDRKFNWLSFDDWLKRIARKIDEWYSQNLSTFNFVDSPLYNSGCILSISFWFSILKCLRLFLSLIKISYELIGIWSLTANKNFKKYILVAAGILPFC